MTLEVVRADSPGKAAEMLSADSGARFVGGGTIVVRNATSGDVGIGRLVLSDGLGLDQIRVNGGRAEIGAAVTMARIAAHPALSSLANVAREIGGPAVRAMATVGGNLFAAAPYGDLAVALLALDAEVTVEGARDKEVMGLEKFLSTRWRYATSIVKTVSFAVPLESALRFVKVMRRRPHGASVLSIAALLPLTEARVRGARVAYGAMAPTAMRAKAVEQALEGAKLDEATIARAVAVATEGTAPASDPFASDWYRRNVLPVHLARLLKG